jgi:ubiquinone/menaquinone biosynthesis C-methylase UbiE
MSFLTALVYDSVLAHVEERCLRRIRGEMLGSLGGSVLELGAGTGRNLAHYSKDVTSLVLLEPDPHMRKRLVSRLDDAKHSPPTQVSSAPAEALPFDRSSFDHVVSTLVFCSVRDLERSLEEAVRVLAPGGDLVLVEHVAGSPGSSCLRWQRRLDPLWSRLTDGCHLDRDPRPFLARLGMQQIEATLEDLQGAPGFQKVLLRARFRKP